MNRKATKNVDHVLALNLMRLMKGPPRMTIETLVAKSGVSRRMISYIFDGGRMPTIDTVEKLADAFGLRGWHLTFPNLDIEIAKSGGLDKLLTSYSSASELGRDFISRMADHEAKKEKK